MTLSSTIKSKSAFLQSGQGNKYIHNQETDRTLILINQQVANQNNGRAKIVKNLCKTEGLLSTCHQSGIAGKVIIVKTFALSDFSGLLTCSARAIDL